MTLARGFCRISLLSIVATAPWWGGLYAYAQTPSDQALFNSYKTLCSQVRRGTWEMRTTSCAILQEDEGIVRATIGAQVKDVCANIERECGAANKEARDRLTFFASSLRCPAGSSACTKKTSAPPALIDAKAPGTIPSLKQPSNMTCWATVATMMYSWKNNSSESIQSALGKIGGAYLEMFKKNQGMPGQQKPGFLLAMGLKAEAPQNYTAQGWAALIRRHGPLWVTTNEGTQERFSIHAKVMTAIFGDGSGNGTTVVLHNPAGGKVETESLAQFVRKFEDVARIDLGSGADLRPQVVHY